MSTTRDLLFLLLTESQAKQQTSILQLPLNPETKSLRAKDLSWSHYRKVMAAHY